MASTKKLLTAEEVAQRLGWKVRTVYQKRWRREIEYVKVGRSVRFTQEAIDRLIDQGTVPALDAR
jgi:excisionase family DNA binding protein